MTVSAERLPLNDGWDRLGGLPASQNAAVGVSFWDDATPRWTELPPDLVGTRLEDLPPDPLGGFERLASDADAPIEQPPGAALAGVLESVDVADLGEGDVVDVIAAAGRMSSWAAAVELAATAQLTDRTGSWRGVGCELPPSPGGRGMRQIEQERMATAEVAAALNISEGYARFKVEFAEALRRLPLTRIALAAGRIDIGKARAIAEAVMVLDDAAAGEVEARVIDRAGGQTLANLRRSLRRAVAGANPAAAEARRLQRVEDRQVAHYPGEDGIGTLVWNGPLHEQEAFWIWLTAAADAAKFPGDTRTLAQRRSDVLADLAANALDRSVTHTGADLPLRHGRRPHIGVVVAASTLLGLDDEPAELAGAGPITAELARTIAADGTWQRLLTDPASGRLLELSEEAYEPSQQLRDHVIARDAYCRWPGCRMPANRCDLDHAIPHPVGPTTAANLEPLHRPHHVVKTHTDVTVAIQADGTTVWRFPSGHIYRVPPTRVLEHSDLDPAALRAALRALTDDPETEDLDIDAFDTEECHPASTHGHAEPTRPGNDPDPPEPPPKPALDEIPPF